MCLIISGPVTHIQIFGQNAGNVYPLESDQTIRIDSANPHWQSLGCQVNFSNVYPDITLSAVKPSINKDIIQMFIPQVNDVLKQILATQ